MIKRVTWWIHRTMCAVGVHAPEQIFLFDDGTDGFVPDGHFCAVCSKTWEKTTC